MSWMYNKHCRRANREKLTNNSNTHSRSPRNVHKQILIAIVLITFQISGCSKDKSINILSEYKYLSLPITACEFTGYTRKIGIKINIEHTNNKKLFLRLTNLSKFNAIITDQESMNLLKSYDRSWIKICEVAIINDAKKTKFFLCVRRNFAVYSPQKLMKLIKVLEEGTIYLKDENLLEFLADKNGVRYEKKLKFKGCKVR